MFLSSGWCSLCENLMHLARHAFDMMKLLLVVWCRLHAPHSPEKIFFISEDSIWRKTVCVRCYVCICVCIDICILKFVVDKKLAGLVPIAIKTLTAPIGFLLEMSFMMSNWYVFVYMHMIDYTCFLLWLLVVEWHTSHSPENTFILAQCAEFQCAELMTP